MSTRKLVIALGSGVVALAIVAALNPGNMLTRRSENFSSAAFEQVKVGDSAQSIVASLGEPLEIRPAGSVGDCADCSIYLFLGKPRQWAFRYEEAWALVDKQGLVVRKVRTQEP